MIVGVVEEEMDLMTDPAETGAEAESEAEGTQESDTGASDDVAELRSQFTELQRQNQELLARLSAPPAAAQPVAQESDDEDDEEVEDADPAKLADELSTLGVAALRKRGFISVKEARKIARDEAEKIANRVVDSRAERMSAESTALAPYSAELNDTKSPFRAKVSEIFSEMVKVDPKLKDSPAALAMACRTAKAEMGTASTKNDAAEAERQRKVARQAGDSGARGGGGERGGFNGEGRPTMTDQDREVARKMGITEKEFLASKSQLRSGK